MIIGKVNDERGHAWVNEIVATRELLIMLLFTCRTYIIIII